METILIAGLGMASVLDLKWRKIPNSLTFCLAVSGLILQTSSWGFQGFIQGLSGLLVGGALLMIPFAMGGMGGGDVKLLAAIGVFVGPVHVFHVFLAGAVFGGLLSLAAIAKEKAWTQTFQNLRDRLMYSVLAQKWDPESRMTFTRSPIRVPYALMLTCGYLWTTYFGGH